MSPRFVGAEPDDEGGASSVAVSLQQLKDEFDAVEVFDVGGDYLTKKERLERISEVSSSATQMAEWRGENKRFWIVLCGECGDVFIRRSGPKGYEGKSTWKGRCPNGHKANKADEMVGEAVGR